MRDGTRRTLGEMLDLAEGDRGFDVDRNRLAELLRRSLTWEVGAPGRRSNEGESAPAGWAGPESAEG